MNWRRVLLWLGLAAIVIGAVVLVARVSMMAFRSGPRAAHPVARMLADAGMSAAPALPWKSRR